MQNIVFLPFFAFEQLDQPVAQIEGSQNSGAQVGSAEPGEVATQLQCDLVENNDNCVLRTHMAVGKAGAVLYEHLIVWDAKVMCSENTQGSREY